MSPEPRAPAATAEPSRRLFFALWPDEAAQSALAAATCAAAASGDGRLVPAQNFHLTLAFLGAVPESRIAAVNAVAAAVATGFAANVTLESPPHGERIVVTLDRIEHWRSAHILCATSSAPTPEAGMLSEVLKRALIDAGFSPDLKPFRAHATFARKVQRVTHALTMPPVAWGFHDFHLVESRSRSDGSAYSSREKWALYTHAR